MKLTPFILFLILLFVLVISIIFSRFLPLMNSQEGFISFKATTQPLNYAYIPQYSSSNSSNSVVKLYDNLFFDMTNTNVIEVNGNTFIGNLDNSADAGNADTTGISISGVYVVRRDGSKNTSPYTTKYSSDGVIQPNDTDESKIKTIPYKYNSWIYDTVSANPDKYQLFYISWGTDTYLHVINTSKSSHIASFVFGDNSVMEQYKYPGNLSVSIGKHVEDTDTDTNKKVKVSKYPTNTLYQFSKNVKFDFSNANLIITNTVNSDIVVYNRSGNIITDYATNVNNNVTNSKFNPFIVVDSSANNMILYLPFHTDTVLAVIYLDPSDNTKYKLGNVVRFTSKGVDDGSNRHKKNDYENKYGHYRKNRHDDDDYGNDDGNYDDFDIQGDANSEYYKWLAYWNTTVNAKNKKSVNFNDYLLKTQIVPPVCPTCPSCNISSGVCNSCGGQGGCGTKKNDGESIVKTNGNTDLKNNNLGVASATADIARTGGGVVNNVVDNATGLGVGAELLVGGAGIGAYNLLSNTGSGTADLLKSAGSGATNLVTSAGSGASNMVSNAGSGATDLLKSTGSGVLSLGQGSQPQYGGQQQQIGGGGQQQQIGGGGQVRQSGVGAPGGADYFSYYGALPSNRQSNFLPITANFSAFSK
jgi:hypothetical protein